MHHFPRNEVCPYEEETLSEKATSKEEHRKCIASCFLFIEHSSTSRVLIQLYMHAIHRIYAYSVRLPFRPDWLVRNPRGNPNVWKVLEDSNHCIAGFHQCVILCSVSVFATRNCSVVHLLPRQSLGPPLKSTYPAPGRAFLINSPLSHLSGRNTLAS